MKEILDKISSYDLFNNLLPGVLFVAIADKFTNYSFIGNDLIVAAFICYFIGLVISRLGSLIIEPVLKKASFLKFADYKEFVSASKKDTKIDLLSESNNMYRTFCSMLMLLIILKFYESLEWKFQALKDWTPYILVGLLLIIFLYSYRKQTSYITKIIKTNNE